MRRFRSTAIGLLQLSLAGCYTFGPPRGVEPQVGTVVAVDLNDAGRSALGGSMGPDLSQVQGAIIEKDSASYVLAVSAVKLRQGGEQAWSGERVRILPGYFYNMSERRFSLGRTLAIGALGAGGLGAILLSASLIGSGTGEDGGGGCPPDCGTTRFGRP